MADIKTFHLPDLGEGLPDATIVEWLAKVGGTVKLDEPLVSMETARPSSKCRRRSPGNW
jgi:pyruvate dehydrogenase E2 component (dihydrolipoamide acetyltransferase)